MDFLCAGFGYSSIISTFMIDYAKHFLKIVNKKEKNGKSGYA